MLQTYPIVAADGQQLEFYHYDLYRIEHPSALQELGLEEALAGITLIEWPERLEGYSLPVSLAVSIALADDGTRRITYESNDARWRNGW
jgi:tRNA A37 threonylcarbamoyladenosine biosynthesis protein TsaE